MLREESKHPVDLIGIGAMNMDCFYQVQSILTDDESTVGRYVALPGGSAANTIYALAKLGVKAGFVGAVGDDEAGLALVQDLQRVGVDASHVKIKAGAKSGSVFCLIDPKGRRALYVSPGANTLLKKEDIDLDYIARGKVLHLSSFADNEQMGVQKWIVENIPREMIVTFSPGAIYARRGLQSLLPIIRRVNILFVNQKELNLLTGRSYDDGAARLLEFGCGVVVVTMGKGRLDTSEEEEEKSAPQPRPTRRTGRGLDSQPFQEEGQLRLNLDLSEEESIICSYITDGRQEIRIEPKQEMRIEVVDTTGAGDAFAAGFLFGFLNRLSLAESGRLAQVVAECSVSRVGSRSGLPSFDELLKKYEEYYHVLPSYSRT